MTSELSAEDKKLVTLARSTRARVQAAEGAAVRDGDGRTYAAATVDLPSLHLSAVQACVAMAVASGSTGVVACVLLGEADELTAADRAVLADFGSGDAGVAGGGVTVHLGDPRGAIRDSSTA